MARQQTERASTARRLSRWSANLVVTVVIAACAAWLLPSLMGYSRYVITGGSMTGTYDKGSIVLEKPVPVNGLKVGDVITYLPPADSGVSNLVTHRILEMKPAAGGGMLFTTKGDANPKPDPWHFTLVSQEQPVVQLGVPHAGWVLIALADRNTRMMVIGGPAALIALVALGQLMGAARGNGKKPTAEAPAAHA
ncbi:hypothetical protein GCM10009740_21290 [Terrabacter terrae]|uniref:Signal peptidase I n=1 Tax=Terrabacter terrae TaxID=318434 RepID=A0ABN2U8R9_9MICO